MGSRGWRFGREEKAMDGCLALKNGEWNIKMQ